MIKLPIFAVVRETYAFVWRERRLFWALAVPGIIILSLLSALQKWAEWTRLAAPDDVSGTLRDVASQSAFFEDAFPVILVIVVLLIESAIFILYAVAWHRAYLVPEESPSPASAYRWRPRQTKFAMNYLRLLAVFGPLLLVGGLVGGVAIPALVEIVKTEAPEKLGWIVLPGLLIVLGGIAFSIFLAARLSLIFPAAAVDHSPTLRRSWDFSRGNALRLFWAGALVTVPIAVLSFIPSGLTALIWWKGLGGSLSMALLSSLLEQCFAFVYLALGVSVLSICYRRLTAAA